MDTLLQISFFAVLVFAGVTALAGAFVFAGHALAAEAVEEYDDTHVH